MGARTQRARGSGESGTAAIRLGGRDLLRTTAGVALVVWGPDGQLLRVAALQAADGFLVPVLTGALAAYPLIGASDGQVLFPNAWVDVTPSMGSGSVAVRIPAGRGSSSMRATTPGSLRRSWSTQVGAPSR